MVGIVGRTPAVEKKCDVFLSFCLFVTLWNYEVCYNGNAIFKTVMVLLNFLWTPEFFLRGKHYHFSPL